MKIGYSFWGFLADIKIRDGKEVSTPDGNAFYSWSIIFALLNAGHKVYRMLPDRDREITATKGINAFKSFAREKRQFAYHGLINEWPDDLDVLLMEWRFPIPGRNCNMAISDPSYQPDLAIQYAMLAKYVNTKTKIIIFDLDYKITEEDEKSINPYCILETSNKPKDTYAKRIAIDIPFDFEEINTFGVRVADSVKQLVYVGNRYERDRLIEKYLVPLTKISQHRNQAATYTSPLNVHLYGNWLESGRDSQIRWPNFIYHDRISMKDFRAAYGNSCATILLAKDEYLKSGFMTARILESIFFGTIPIGISEFYKIEKYLPEQLIISEPEEIIDIVNKSLFDYNWRVKMIHDLRGSLKIMDCRNFVKTIEEII